MTDLSMFLQIGTSFWIVLAIIFGVVELLTMGLVTIWFCGGALAAALVAGVGLSPVIQIVVFFVVSAILLWVTRPIAQKMLNAKTEKTNYEALLGCFAMVEKDIEPFKPGQVKLQGKEWTAICEDENMSIKTGEKVIVKDIQGVKLIVSKVGEQFSETETATAV